MVPYGASGESKDIKASPDEMSINEVKSSNVCYKLTEIKFRDHWHKERTRDKLHQVLNAGIYGGTEVTP